jgi:hypothetical protein
VPTTVFKGEDGQRYFRVRGWTGIRASPSRRGRRRRGQSAVIWQILYPIIIATVGYVFVQAARGRLPLVVALPFAINLVANLIFTPIQFGMLNLPLAAADIQR